MNWTSCDGQMSVDATVEEQSAKGSRFCISMC